MSCSALKRKYRDQLRHHCPSVRFLLLEGGRDLIERRQASRPGHFMPASLLTSQFATLEPLAPDEDGVVLDVDRSVDEIVQGYLAESRPRRTDVPDCSPSWPTTSSSRSPPAGS